MQTILSFKKITLETEIQCSKVKDIVNLFNSLNMLDQDPKDPKPYLFSDAQNVYNRVVLVCTVSV